MIRLRYKQVGSEYRIIENRIEIIDLCGHSHPSLLTYEDLMDGIINNKYNIIKTAITKEKDA